MRFSPLRELTDELGYLDAATSPALAAPGSLENVRGGGMVAIGTDKAGDQPGGLQPQRVFVKTTLCVMRFGLTVRRRSARAPACASGSRLPRSSRIALAGVAAGREGGFGYVVGVDRAGHAEALRSTVRMWS
jgi:hypothetical protein